MSWTHSSTKPIERGDEEAIGSSHGRSRTAPGKSERLLPMPRETRSALTEFYRQRELQDRRRYESGAQRMLGTVYALGRQRLERGEEVLESYKVLGAAGLALTPEAIAVLEGLPNDWRHVCRIDAEGNVWTASLRERKRTGR